MQDLRFNTAIAKLIELNNHLTAIGTTNREVADSFALMLAPLAPHMAEELWQRLGHEESLVHHPFPVADPALLVDELINVPVQVQGKVRAKLSVPPGTAADALEAAALADPAVVRYLEGKTVQKVIVVPDRMINIVVELANPVGLGRSNHF